MDTVTEVTIGIAALGLVAGIVEKKAKPGGIVYRVASFFASLSPADVLGAWQALTKGKPS